MMAAALNANSDTNGEAIVQIRIEPVGENFRAVFMIPICLAGLVHSVTKVEIFARGSWFRLEVCVSNVFSLFLWHAGLKRTTLY
jgi:hypothetical protein